MRRNVAAAARKQNQFHVVFIMTVGKPTETAATVPGAKRVTGKSGAKNGLNIEFPKTKTSTSILCEAFFKRSFDESYAA